MRIVDSSDRIRVAKRGTRLRLASVVLLLVLAGCSSLPRATDEPRVGSSPPVSGDTPAPDRAGVEFTISASMLDTWNAVGQIVIRLDGVAYESRAQMLGIYGVRFRGEPLLLVTRARVMQVPGDGLVTEVVALRQDGTPTDSAAAVELLSVLQQRLPAELARIAAGER